MIKKLFITLILILLASNIHAETIKIGYFQLPPLQYFDNDTQKPRGATFTYFKEMAAQLDYEVEWIGPLPLLRYSGMLEEGEIDGALGFHRNKITETFLHFLDEPLFYAQPILIVRKDNPLAQLRSIDDIDGYKIGAVVSLSGLYTPFFDNHRDKITLVTLGGDTWLEQNLKKLLALRIDAIFDRQPYSVQFIATEMHIQDQIKLLPLPEPATPMYIVFSKSSQQGKKYCTQFNTINSTFKLDYEELAKQELQWFKEKQNSPNIRQILEKNKKTTQHSP
jgi:ABC-type amino acid transport substrate-binding protein